MGSLTVQPPQLGWKRAAQAQRPGMGTGMPAISSLLFFNPVTQGAKTGGWGLCVISLDILKLSMELRTVK